MHVRFVLKIKHLLFHNQVIKQLNLLFVQILSLIAFYMNFQIKVLLLIVFNVKILINL